MEFKFIPFSGDRRMSITQKPVVKAWPSVFYVGTTPRTTKLDGPHSEGTGQM